MKRLLMLSSLCLVLVAAYAAPRNTFYFLHGQKQVNVVFNYDNLRFDISLSPTELTSFRNAYQAIWEQAFVRELTDELEETGITATQNAPELPYTIVVHPTKASRFGFTQADVQIRNAKGVVKNLSIRGEKDFEHSLRETYVDSMEELGGELGDILERGL